MPLITPCMAGDTVPLINRAEPEVINERAAWQWPCTLKPTGKQLHMGNNASQICIVGGTHRCLPQPKTKPPMAWILLGSRPLTKQLHHTASKPAVLHPPRRKVKATATALRRLCHHQLSQTRRRQYRQFWSFGWHWPQLYQSSRWSNIVYVYIGDIPSKSYLKGSKAPPRHWYRINWQRPLPFLGSLT